MPPEALAALFDIVEACRRISRVAAGKQFADYQRDELLRWGIERKLGIAGGALSRLRRIAPTAAEGITDWQRIIAFRNRLIHGYDAVTDAVVWGVVQRSVPILAVEATAILERIEEGGLS